MAYYIGVDIGTSGTKTVLFTAKGKTVASAAEEYPLYQPQNGYAEQEQLIGGGLSDRLFQRSWNRAVWIIGK